MFDHLNLHYDLAALMTKLKTVAAFVDNNLQCYSFYVLVCLLIFLSIQDMRQMKVSLLALILFNLVTLCTQTVFSIPTAITILIIIIAIKLFCLFYAHKSVIGNGDLLLIFPMLATITTAKIGLFLVIAGVSGALFGYVWKLLFNKAQAPFIPSLAISYLVLI